MEENSIIGKAVPRVDAVEKATGKAIYTDDFKLAGMLIGKIKRSPHPHARILRIDTSRAEKLPGVKAVVTGKDTTGRKFGTIKAYKAIWDELPLCMDKVRYIGDEVAAVAAVDEDTALEALDLIDVEYEELPAVFDPLEAMKPGAPVIHEGFQNNISMQVFLEAGDIEQGFKDSYRVFEDRFENVAVAHSPMEPHTSVASYVNGKVTLWSSTQSPFVVRMALAHQLDLPEAQVRVLKMTVGGGFGGKTDLYALDVCCVLLSQKAGRPVKIALTRQEEFETTRTRHSIIVELKTGVTKDGIILAKQARNILDGGAYTGVGLVAPYLSNLFLTLPYKAPNIKLEATRVYTNKVRGGAMRGYGSPQVIFAADSQMDIIAHELGIDPVELRSRNAITTGYQTSNGLRITSSAFPETIEKSAKGIAWAEKHGKMKKENKGMGMGCSGYIVGTGVAGGTPSNYSAGAIIKLHTDGFATLFTGAVDIGQGSDTVLSMIAAEELGIPLSKVKVVAGDTELTPFDLGQISSRTTFQTGNAVKRAAAEAKAKLLKVVAKNFEISPEDLEAKDERIYVKGSPDKVMAFKDAVFACQAANKGLEVVGNGAFAHELEQTIYTTGRGNYSPAYTFSTAAAEVKVDKETGEVEVLKIHYAHDIGKAINPINVKGQVEGSVQMGMGYALFESLLFDKGRLLNPTLSDYKLALTKDMPEIGVTLVESDDPGAPFGAKGCGEGTVAPVAPSIANAIFDAVGVRIKSLPITPEKILNALKEKEKAG